MKTKKCPSCEGTGEAIYKWWSRSSHTYPCSVCDGNGKVPSSLTDRTGINYWARYGQSKVTKRMLA